MHIIIKNILSISDNELNPMLDELKAILTDSNIEDFDKYISCIHQGLEDLTFLKTRFDKWPIWIPEYVRYLYGMNGFSFDHIGGFASAFNGEESKQDLLCWLGLYDHECEIKTEKSNLKT